MQILILQGSPVLNGSSHMLSSEFARGAKEAGHVISSIETAHVRVAPCSGCVRCGYNGPCVMKDDMETVRPQILTSDMLVFATPLYYFGMSAQLKTLVDRFCAFNATLQHEHMRSALIASAWNSDDWTFEALETHYATLVRYLNLRDQGMILGRGCGTPSATRSSPYLRRAFDLGRSIR